MCDVNDLKRFNDTRGHSFGDEMLRRSCRMICEIFKNSQVYRNGGDEFVVVLTGEDVFRFAGQWIIGESALHASYLIFRINLMTEFYRQSTGNKLVVQCLESQ